jgi:hypothetical protein
VASFILAASGFYVTKALWKRVKRTSIVQEKVTGEVLVCQDTPGKKNRGDE